MKKQILFCLTFLLVATASFSQGYYLYNATLTANSGNAAPHANEVQLNSFTSGFSVTSQNGAALQDFTITKYFDLSSLRLQAQALRATVMATNSPVEIRAYDAQDVLVYSIKLEGVLFTSNSNGGSIDTNCQTGCPIVNEQYTLQVSSKITTTNFQSSPNQILIYDVVRKGVTLIQ